jgi:hypothetical protein
MDLTLLQIACALFLAVCVGAVLPLLRGWSHSGLHVFVSVSAGIFLGTIFLHLLPELAGRAGGHSHGPGGDEGHLGPWVAALLGLLLLFLLERVVLAKRAVSKDRTDPHTVLWSATYLGLALHSFSTGLGIAPWFGDGELLHKLLLPILLHKATEAFSLATVMRLAGLRTTHTVALLAVFALVAPIGLLFGSELSASGWQDILAGFAVGTFLYVALMDLLPEVFHGNERIGLKLLSLVFGIALTAVTQARAEWLGGFALDLLREGFVVFVEMSPFLLLGFLIAGFLSQVIRPAWLTKLLAKNDTRSVVIASLAGAPLPLCSCSVLPVAASLRKSGASKGATSAFLIATPDTGVDSVTVTYVLLGPLMAVLRPIAAIVAAIVTGSAVNALVRSGHDEDSVSDASDTEPIDPVAAACCAHEPETAVSESDPVVGATAESATEPDGMAACHPGEHAAHAHAHAPGQAPDQAEPKGFLRRSLRYAFVDMLDDLSGPLLIGILLAGAVTALVPVELFETPLGSGFGGMLMMLAIGIPIYVCAAASTPIAAALILKGLSPGAALVFLLASPATNLGSLYVITRYLGRRVVLVHVLALAAVTLVLGLGTDLVYSSLAVDAVAACHECATLIPEGFAIACAVVLAVLMLVSLVRTRLGSWPFRTTAGSETLSTGEARGA